MSEKVFVDKIKVLLQEIKIEDDNIFVKILYCDGQKAGKTGVVPFVNSTTTRMKLQKLSTIFCEAFEKKAISNLNVPLYAKRKSYDEGETWIFYALTSDNIHYEYFYLNYM